MVVAKAAIFETLDEVFEEEARYRRVDDGPGHGVVPSNLEGRAEQFLELGGFQGVILDRAPALMGAPTEVLPSARRSLPSHRRLRASAMR